MNFRRFLFLFLLLVVAAGLFFFLRGRKADRKSAAASGPPRATAVIVTRAEVTDLPLWLTGIGSVQAYNTITVRPRTSGALDKVLFTEGTMVKEGDVLAEIDPRPYQAALSQAEAKRAQDQAQFTNARLAAKRAKALAESEAISRQELDEAEASLASLTALVAADDAAVAAARLDLDLTAIRAPITGRTGIRLIDAGNLVSANQEQGIVVLTQLQPISVIFTLPQHNLPLLAPKVLPGAPPLRVQALDDDGKPAAEGTLELIDNRIDTSTGTIRLKAVFENRDLALWPGQFVTARVLADVRTQAVTLPPQAVQPGVDGLFCYVVKEDQTVEVRPVRTGLPVEGRMWIEEGLRPGETVVTTGQSKLKPGARVSTREATP